MKITCFEEIKSWQLARVLCRRVYSLTREGAFAKDFGLIDQVRRASGSIMHNIAEGFDGGTSAEFSRFLGYAQRSTTEVKSQLYIALDQSYINDDEFKSLYQQCTEIHQLIGGFIKHLKNK